MVDRRHVMSTQSLESTAAEQGRLWSLDAAAWAELHEPYMEPAYRAGIAALEVGDGTRYLDVGCGAGLALRTAAGRGAEVTGIDAAPGLLEYARRRVPDATLVRGEFQSLPF